MKKYQMKLMSTVVIMAMLVVSLTGCNDAKDNDATANAENTSDDKSEKEKTETLAKAVTDGITTTGMEAGKDETVYVVLNEDGSVSDITVNDVLKNIDAGNVSDSSELTDIKNIKGDEAYTGSPDSMVWAGTGNNITYQGTIQKDLPISVKISYTLDGKDVTADALAGAAGHVTMKYEYTNNTQTTESVNGAKKNVVVPFVVASGMLLSSDKCSNVTVDNGKVIEEGSNIIVVGYALPGIMDCVKSQVNDEEGILDKFNIPESVTIEADVVDFEQDMCLTVALPNVLGEKGDKKLDYTEITDKMDDLSEASTKLVDGTSRLDDGVYDLKTGSGDLRDGARDLDKGAVDLNNGASTLKKGSEKLEAGAKALKKGTSDLNSGAKQVAEGLETLNGKSSELKSGTDSVSAGAEGLATGAVQLDAGAGQLAAGAATVDQKVGEVQTGAAALDEGAAQLKAGFEGEKGAVAGAKAIAAGTSECTDGVGTLIATMKQTPEAIQKQIDTIMAQVKAMSGIDTEEKLASTISSIDAAITTNESAAPVATVLASVNIDSYATYVKLVQANYSVIALEGVKKTLTDSITQNAESMNKLNSGMQTLKAGTAGLSAGIDTMYTGVTKLANGTESLKTGSAALKTGTAALAASAVKLKEGTAGLAAGANKLNAGTKTYSNGITSLIDGIVKLDAGSAKLYKGSKSLNKGAGTLYKGLVTLDNGASKLYSGTTSLKEGTGKLYSGTGDLCSGAGDLKDGSTELKDGMIKFNEDGVEKITGMLGDNLRDAADLLQAIVDQGSDYDNFAGISDGMNGEVKFIYKTEAIQKAEEE